MINMKENIITVTLGDDLSIRGPSLFQYDRGLILVFDGVTLPESYEVHFSNDKHGLAKKGEITENGVMIPDEFLQKRMDLFAWIFIRNGEEFGYTIYSIQFPVIGRSKKIM